MLIKSNEEITPVNASLICNIHTRHTLVAKHLFPTLSIRVSVRPLDMIPVLEVQIPSNM